MDIKCAFTEMWDIEKIVPHPRNTNKHPQKQIDALAKIIKARGFRHPLIISKRSGFLCAGHGRLAAAQQLGLTEVPVDLQDFESEAEEFVFLNADNNIARYAEFDQQGMLDGLKELDIDLTGFDFDDVGLLDFEFTLGPDPEKEAIEDEIPEQVETRCKPGDLWILGEHRLLCGDSTNIQHVERLMGGEKAALVLTDPPYNVAVNDESEASLKARNRRSDGLKIANDKMSEEGFIDFLRQVFSNYEAVMHEGASIYVFYADSMTLPFMTTFMEAGFHFAQNCIWNKQQFVMTRKDYHYKHEPVMYGWKKGQAHSWRGDRKQSSVWNFDRPFKNELHPTMKPINLLEYPVQNSSSIGSLVLDLFGGSGSTLIACEKTNRKCFMMEVDPHYCDVIIERWEKYSGQAATLMPE